MFSWHFVLRRGLQISAGKKMFTHSFIVQQKNKKASVMGAAKDSLQLAPTWSECQCHNSQFDSAQWHFFQRPNSSTELLPIEWNKNIVRMLYFYWNIFCLSQTTAGNACIRKQNTDELWVIRCSVTYFVSCNPTSTTEKFLNREP